MKKNYFRPVISLEFFCLHRLTKLFINCKKLIDFLKRKRAYWKSEYNANFYTSQAKRRHRGKNIAKTVQAPFFIQLKTTLRRGQH